MNVDRNKPSLSPALRGLLIGALVFYQKLISPVIHGLAGPRAGCRFQPSCSTYGIESVRKFGVRRGAYLLSRRLLRCGPWSKGGYDPVPEGGQPESFKKESHPEAQPESCGHSHHRHSPSHG